jgi:hypothetical protein
LRKIYQTFYTANGKMDSLILSIRHCELAAATTVNCTPPVPGVTLNSTGSLGFDAIARERAVAAVLRLERSRPQWLAVRLT